MNSSHKRIETIPVKLTDNSTIFVETTILGGREEVSITDFKFSDISNCLKLLSEDLFSSIKKIRPNKAVIEFGIEIGLESGKLAALLVKGTGNANIKIALEWNNKVKK